MQTWGHHVSMGRKAWVWEEGRAGVSAPHRVSGGEASAEQPAAPGTQAAAFATESEHRPLHRAFRKVTGITSATGAPQLTLP